MTLLSGAAPIFLLNRSHHGGEQFASLARDVKAAASAAELGTIVKLSAHGSASARAILDAADLPVRIADPEFADHQSVVPDISKRRLDRAPWLAGTLPNRPTPGIIDAVLSAQRAAGANVLMTPTGVVSTVKGEHELARTMRWVSATRATAPTEPLIVGLTLSRSWLVDPDLREILLNEIVDSIEPVWSLRIRWPELRPRHAQLGESSLLEAYAMVAAVMAGEGKVLLLPQTGLTGWLLSGLGAAGFSVGTGGQEQAYADSVPIRIKGPRRPPIARIFEPSILHTVRVTTQGILAARPGYAACTCASCASMRGAGTLIDASRWDGSLAARHLVMSLARMQAGLAGPDRRAIVRDALDSAVTATMGAHPPLTGEDRPGHLAPWRALVGP